jgi:hypothetical protein
MIPTFRIELMSHQAPSPGDRRTDDTATAESERIGGDLGTDQGYDEFVLNGDISDDLFRLPEEISRKL